MFTRENYNSFVLKGFQQLVKFIEKDSRYQVALQLPVSVNVIISDEYMLTPLVLALLHNSENTIQYFLTHESMNLSFFHGKCNPFLYALQRCIDDIDNDNHVNVLLQMIVSNANLETDLDNKLLACLSVTHQNLAYLIFLVRKYRVESNPIEKLIILSHISEHCNLKLSKYKFVVEWELELDYQLMELADSGFISVLTEYLNSNSQFYQIFASCVNKLYKNKDNYPEYIKPFRLMNGCLALARYNLKKSLAEKHQAYTYFINAEQIVEQFKLAITDEKVTFFKALSIYTVEERYLKEEIDEGITLKFILALKESVSLGSWDALSILGDMALSPNKFNRNIMIANILHNLYRHYNPYEAAIPIRNELNFIASGLRNQFSIEQPQSDFSQAFNDFEKAALDGNRHDERLTLFACDLALRLLIDKYKLLKIEKRKLSSPRKIDELEEKSFCPVSTIFNSDMGINELMSEHKSKEQNIILISDVITKAVKIFDIMLTANPVPYEYQAIKEHLDKIVYFARSTVKYSDRIKILHAIVNFYKHTINYFAGSISGNNSVAEVKKLFNYFIQLIDNNSLLERNGDWPILVNVLCQTINKSSNFKIRLKIFQKLIDLTELAKIKNEVLQYDIMFAALEAYHPRCNELSLEELKILRDYCLEFQALATNMKRHFSFEKYADFFIKLAETDDPVSDNEAKIHDYRIATQFGRKEAVYPALNLMNDSIVSLNLKLRLFKDVLFESLYPERKEFILLAEKQINSHIEKMKQVKNHEEDTYLNKPDNTTFEIQELLILIKLSSRCVRADNNKNKLIELVNEDYLPALIKLTLFSLKNDDLGFGLYCAAKLTADLILYPKKYTELYGISEQLIVKLKLRLTSRVSSIAQSDNIHSKLALWVLQFIMFVNKTENEIRDFLGSLNVNYSLNIDSLILGNAETSILLSVTNDIQSAIKMFVCDKYIDLIRDNFFLLKKLNEKVVSFETFEDITAINSNSQTEFGIELPQLRKSKTFSSWNKAQEKSQEDSDNINLLTRGVSSDYRL